MRILSRLGTFAAAAVFLTSAGASSSLHAQDPARETQISFRPDTIVEAAFFRVGAGNQEALNQRYLSKVLPLAEEFGMKQLGFFVISEVVSGPDDAKVWGLFQWPDLHSRERFESDPRFIELRAIRDELMDSFKIVHLRPKKAFKLTFRSDRLYEFSGLWMNRTHGNRIERYLAAARPFGEQHDVSLIDGFDVIGTSERYPFLPQQVFIIDWPSKDVKAKWIASESFRSAGWNRALAIDQAYGVEAQFLVR